MERSCKSLKHNEEVIFRIYSDIYKNETLETGTVCFVTDTHVCVSWLEGYKDRHDFIPFPDMVAVHNPQGEYMDFGFIRGNSDLLIP